MSETIKIGDKEIPIAEIRNITIDAEPPSKIRLELSGQRVIDYTADTAEKQTELKKQVDRFFQIRSSKETEDASPPTDATTPASETLTPPPPEPPASAKSEW